ncbi:putative receptor like protein 25 [Cryptomeria japonica]|uniref:putative receptor like protein 25 n=1 Tax=Cryptomeria japonica TaxID=3369 RepID=UPI0027DA5F92|nr:putative receptor like protein 25 [Cryptomeria japonica]
MADQSEKMEIFEHEIPFNPLTSYYYIDEITVYNKGQQMEFVKILRLVKCLDLSSNNLSGNILHNIGSLKGLIILNISRNHFSGEIPKSIGEMTLLQSLDLSQNGLSGAIITELQLLTSLSFFNVSCNKLSGMIPQGGQMTTFDSTYFSNNSGLCGLQIYVPCSSNPPNSPKVHEENNEDSEDDFWWDMGMATDYVVAFSISLDISGAVFLMQLGDFPEDYVTDLISLQMNVLALDNTLIKWERSSVGEGKGKGKEALSTVQ